MSTISFGPGLFQQWNSATFANTVAYNLSASAEMGVRAVLKVF